MSSKKTILVADDDPEMLQILTDKLISEGFDVVQARDGEEAFQDSLKHPDLILLDILMPKMDGLEVMKSIRARDEWGLKEPIFLITNVDPDDKTLKAVADAKPTYYMMKGYFNLDALVDRIRETLRV